MKSTITLHLINAEVNNDNDVQVTEVDVANYSFKPVETSVAGTPVKTLLSNQSIHKWYAVESLTAIGELLKDDAVVETVDETVKPYAKINAKELADEATKRGLGFTLESTKKELVALLEADDAATTKKA